MAARANPKLIGVFVVGGLALLVLVVIGFASTSFFAARIPIVMYFPGDVGGLDVGAAVTFKGVHVGTVTNVELRYNVAEMSFQIPVHAEILPEHFTVVGHLDEPRSGKRMSQLIKAGLRARLGSESLVTGKLLVNLDFYPDTPITLVGNDDKDFMEVPTLPTQMAELQASISGFLTALGKADLPGLVGDMRKLVTNVDTQVTTTDTSALVEQLRGVLDSVQQDAGDLTASLTRTSDTLNREIGSLSTEGVGTLRSANGAFTSIQATVSAARPIVDNLDKAAQRAAALMVSAQGAIEPGSPLQRELLSTLKEIGTAARSLRVLSDNLARNPNSVLFGKTGTARQ